MALEIIAVPAFADNYLWLVHDQASGETAVVDPGDPAPVLAEAERRGWTIDQVWNTHWHPDHTGANLAIKAATGCTITGPAGEAAKIPGIDRAVAQGDTVSLGASSATVIDVPGHTAGHNAYWFAGDRVLFCGDTLFAGEVGRPDLIGGGTEERLARQLYRSFHGKLLTLPDAVEVFPAHGEGSPCGGSIGDRKTTTVGYERLHNPKHWRSTSRAPVGC